MIDYLSYSSPSGFKSKFNPVIGINPEFLFTYNNDFLHPLFLRMCEELNIDHNKFDYLPIENLITEKEFEQINMELAKPYFYEKIFTHIRKNNIGRIENDLLFTFTYDIELAPISKRGIRYGVINLGRKPIFYYCYIDLQQAIEFIKSLE